MRPDPHDLSPYRREPHSPAVTPEAIGALATRCLELEIDTFPKPGLVSHVDSGSHRDMDATMLRRSALTLEPFFVRLAAAAARGEGMDRLRFIGLEAEAAMLQTTHGVNTHRGAIFGLGLLSAAAGLRGAGLAPHGERLGAIVRSRFATDIQSGPVALLSHGTQARRLYGATGARGEAIAGFPTIRDIGLPALAQGRTLAPFDPEAARIHVTFALIGTVKDTNLLHRGGAEGLAFARSTANDFMRQGGIARHGWRLDATFIHAEFVKRNLSPGGSADLLAMSLFVDAIETDPT